MFESLLKTNFIWRMFLLENLVRKKLSKIKSRVSGPSAYSHAVWIFLYRNLVHLCWGCLYRSHVRSVLIITSCCANAQPPCSRWVSFLRVAPCPSSHMSLQNHFIGTVVALRGRTCACRLSERIHLGRSCVAKSLGSRRVGSMGINRVSLTCARWTI